MDKDKFAVNHPPNTSWLEMQQFIGDLMASGGSTYSQSVRDLSQQEALRAVWETTGSESQRLKDLHPAPAAPLQPRKVQDKPGPSFGRQPLAESGEAAGEARDGAGAQVQHHTCTCPGCPYSSSYPFAPPSLHTLKPRGAPPSPDPTRRPPKGPGAASLGDQGREEADEPSSTSSQREPGRLRGHDPGASADAPLAGSRLPAYPCLCCPCSFQTCGQLLHRQQGAAAAEGQPFPHAHAHHHFHHHHCPFTSCLPCPTLVHAHPASAPPPGLFPCLPCQCSLTTCCARLLRHQPGHAPQREEGGGGGGGATLGPTHPCMHCPASFPRPSQLLQHQRSQHAHKPAGFLCVECGRQFNSHSNLRIHLNVHTGARPYCCPDCGKSFSQSGALKIHRRIHTGERPYTCSYCGRGFPHLAGVRAHQRTHTGEKPYRCPQCGKCFTQSGALKIHTRIHTGERPFACGVCGKGFSNRSGVRFHHRTVHGPGPEPGGVGRTAGGPAGWGAARQGGPPVEASHHSAGPAAGVGLSACSDSRAGVNPGGAPPAPRMGPPGTGVAVRPENKPQSLTQSLSAGGTSLSGRAESCGEKDGSGRTLMYACEDCGLRFCDAPSRNRHQTLEHYSTEEGGETRRE